MSNIKLKVKKEGRKGVFLCDKQDIKNWIKERGFEAIHNMVGGGSLFIGADWDVESVIEKIDQSERIGILIGNAQANNLGHALSVIAGNKLYAFDIGRITENDLQIDN